MTSRHAPVMSVSTTAAGYDEAMNAAADRHAISIWNERQEAAAAAHDRWRATFEALKAARDTDAEDQARILEQAAWSAYDKAVDELKGTPA
jgi:hypothetical protein